VIILDKYVLALLKCKGIGNAKTLNYIMKYDKNIELIKKHLDELIDEEELQKFDIYLKQSEEEIFENQKNQIEIISVLNENYPTKLLAIKDPVLYLYYKGNINLIYNTSIAVIGSREINSHEELITKKISEKISSKGITVVSGLANGTDTQAHLASFKQKGKTIAVLASGLNIITPSNNRQLAKNILISGGLLVSEYSHNKIATKYSFVKRDRIQAALSDAVIVIKANLNSGTMHTVKAAQSADKYVTQYKTNENNQIYNVFENSENDISIIIKEAKNKKYNIKVSKKYEQTSLF